MRLFTLQIILLFLVVIHGQLFTQPFSEVFIHGRVTENSTGLPIAGVVVVVINEADTTQKDSGITGADGQYVVTMFTGINSRGNLPAPSEFGLFQNYPNPFNPSTRIQFQMPRSSHVRLDIYNTLGQKIRTLVNKKLDTDTYTVEWDCTNDAGHGVAAGIYFYRLQTSGFLETRKMILLDGQMDNVSGHVSAPLIRNDNLKKQNNLMVTIRATSPNIFPFEIKHVAVSTSIGFKFDFKVNCRPLYFDFEKIIISELSDSGLVYITGLPGAVTNNMEGLLTLLVTNHRLDCSVSTSVNPDGSFPLVKLLAVKWDRLSMVLCQEGNPISALENLLIPERVAPVVTNSKPTNGDKDIILDVIVRIYFSEPVQSENIIDQSIFLADNQGKKVPATVGFMSGNTIAYMELADSLEPSSLYNIVVTTDVMDMQGLHLEEIYTASFTTEELHDPLTIHVPADVPTIQAGIDSARDGDTVMVANGYYYENINFKGKSIILASHFLVDGDTSHISGTIIDGSQPANPDSASVVRIISGEDSSTALIGFSIFRGTGTLMQLPHSPPRIGGGILVDSSACIIRNNKITYNILTSQQNDCAGAGIAVAYSDCIIENNLICYNTINSPYNWAGGAGIDVSGNSVTVRNNIIRNNTIHSNWGPGAGMSVYLWSAPDTIFIMDNIIEKNIYNSSQLAAGGGMGILYCQGKVVVSGNRISNNESHGSGTHMYGEAGGIYIENCSPLIVNNIIDNNQAGAGGGITVCYFSGFLPQTTAPHIINNIVSENSAYYGGGIDSYGTSAYPRIRNSILWGNSAALVGQQIRFQSGRMEVSYTDVQGGWSGQGNINTNPLFYHSVQSPGDTLFYCLIANSPCVDAGNPDPVYSDVEDPQNPGYALWPAMGFLRNDMGAYGGPGFRNLLSEIRKNHEFIKEINSKQSSPIISNKSGGAGWLGRRTSGSSLAGEENKSGGRK
ncbi:MAG: right-handed parallel beta-helix repeat-containing protein [Calditrichaeota bacterium]|nr:right-handed parallel beta-helix repeat-containing protein [Calditrichota bacterium]